MLVPDQALGAALLGAGLLTRVALLSYPREVVFDEYHFGKFVNGYLTGQYFFDIHPPLGKLILAACASLGGYRGESEWASIGKPIQSEVNLFALRIGPALQGSLLPPVLFATGRAMGRSQPAALLTAVAALFDIGLLVEQRLVLTDATLLLGIALQLTGCSLSDKHVPLSRGWMLWLAVAGSGISLAVCTKWTGAATLIVAAAHSIIALGRSRLRGHTVFSLLIDAAWRVLLLLLVPVTVYAASFYMHFLLLPSNGPGAVHMSTAFRASLLGDDGAVAMATAPDFIPLSLMARFMELNLAMLSKNAGVSKTHKWGSHWYEWPLMGRPVLYWNGII